MGCKCSLPPLPCSLPFSRRRTSVKSLLVQGKFFKNYKLGEKLGEGAFGQVRSASKIGCDTEYAVKIIDCRKDGRDNNIDHPILRDARQEVRLLGAIPQDNVNVVSLFDSFMEAPGLFYMVMERCYGSLTDRLCDMPKLREVDLSIMFRQMLLGIVACHEMCIVHRDIKLDNFLYGGEGRQTVKLADFGLATELGSKADLLRGISGTAPYMSPEMLGQQGYNEQTDIWSFAASVYIILFGDCPYSPEEPTPAAVKQAIINASPPPTWARDLKLAKLYNQPPQRAVEFCKYLLQRVPTERPTGAEALDHDFLSPDLVTSDEVVETPVDAVRNLTTRFNKKRDPTVQRNLDEILQRLNAARSHFGSLSSLSEGRDETKVNNSEDSGNRTSGAAGVAGLQERSGESRIVTTGQQRVWTHSGVLMENESDSPMFSNLLPVAHEEPNAEVELQDKFPEDEASKATPEAAHDNCPHRPDHSENGKLVPESRSLLEREAENEKRALPLSTAPAAAAPVPLHAVLNQCGTLQ
eukprot:TRINITY_DN4330_c0_g1_i1.p1 TRINITY_DN4330_c0_g1~~TRINITY_DN4330_c0_g1_i1.p1  ORF type:complete len:524 (-),score=100.15 TRINITY_DN4330_c0_g1_i1:81-1652(-)